MRSKFLSFLLIFFSFTSASADDYFGSLLQGDGYGSVLNFQSDVTVNFSTTPPTSVTYSPNPSNILQNIIAITPFCDQSYCNGYPNATLNSYPSFFLNNQNVVNLSSIDLNKLGPSITNLGVLKNTYNLVAGDYSFNWAFAAADYIPFRDAAFFHIYNNATNETSKLSILARNGDEQDFINALHGTPSSGYEPQTLIMPDYGSTPWQQYDFNISAPGSYTLAFGDFNWGDTGWNPVLFLSGFKGEASGSGLISSFSFLPTLTNIIPEGGSSNGAFTKLDQFNHVFEGGIYKITANETLSEGFFILGNSSGTFQTTNLFDATLTGTVSGSGDLIINGNGNLFLSDENTYTGTTTIGSTAALILNGDGLGNRGSISNSSKVIVDGVFDISTEDPLGTNLDAALDNSIKSLDGSGSVVLGAHNLIITNGGDNFGGIISGLGNVTLSSGTQTFSGINTYTGSTTIDNGATLVVQGLSGSIGSSNNIIDNGILNFSNNTSTYNSVISGTGNLAALSNTTLTLGGINTFTGSTTIDTGSTLLLTSSGSISDSSGVQINNLSTFNIAGTSGTSVKAISGTGGVLSLVRTHLLSMVVAHRLLMD